MCGVIAKNPSRFTMSYLANTRGSARSFIMTSRKAYSTQSDLQLSTMGGISDAYVFTVHS